MVDLVARLPLGRPEDVAERPAGLVDVLRRGEAHRAVRLRVEQVGLHAKLSGIRPVIVAVEQADVTPAALGQRAHEVGPRPEDILVRKDAYARVAARPLAHDFRRPVSRRIVADDHLDVVEVLGQCTAQRLVDVLLLLEGDHAYANARRVRDGAVHVRLSRARTRSAFAHAVSSTRAMRRMSSSETDCPVGSVITLRLRRSVSGSTSPAWGWKER